MTRWDAVIVAFALAYAVAGGVWLWGCAKAPEAVAPSAESVAGYGLCESDLAIAKARAVAASPDGGLTLEEKGVLWERYRKCADAVDALFAFDGGAR